MVQECFHKIQQYFVKWQVFNVKKGNNCNKRPIFMNGVIFSQSPSVNEYIYVYFKTGHW